MFKSARIKLTVWYLIIITCISISFSVVIYRILSGEIERFEQISRARIERRLRENMPLFLPDQPGIAPLPFSITNPELLSETEHRILIMLIVINGAIIIASGGLGWILAGKTLEPIAAMMDEQQRFIQDASHELRTPLTSLRSAFEVYLRDKNPLLSDAKQLMQDSLTDVAKLQSLSDSLLSLAQHEHISTKYHTNPVRLAETLAEAEKKIASLAKIKHVRITYQPTDVRVVGNQDMLTDLFVILLDNAVKYSEAHSSVTVSVAKTDGHISVSVKDHGTGIKKTDLPYIFDRFFRGDKARVTSPSGGFGLGLSIAKRIVQTHNGSIDVKSKEHQGTTFTVTLPIFFS